MKCSGYHTLKQEIDFVINWDNKFFRLNKYLIL